MTEQTKRVLAEMVRYYTDAKETAAQTRRTCRQLELADASGEVLGTGSHALDERLETVGGRRHASEVCS